MKHAVRRSSHADLNSSFASGDWDSLIAVAENAEERQLRRYAALDLLRTLALDSRGRWSSRRVAALARNPDPEPIRLAALKTLGAIGDDEAVAVITEILQDGKKDERVEAVKALADVPWNVRDDLLEAALTDKSWRVRRAARAVQAHALSG